MTKTTLHNNYILVETDDIQLSDIKTNYDNRIAGFFGEHRWLSNFWSCDVCYDDITFPSVEHGYVYAKVHLSSAEHNYMLSCSPGDAKRIGKIKMIKPDFEHNKVAIMKELLLSKFKESSLQQQLLSTGTASLVEANNWGDTFWGVDEQGNGLNMLGNLLEEVREHYTVAKIQHSSS